ncbi:hypothetical protein GGD57_003065 [Rhizobium esperanzae]|uniref:Uncharacterized protein n=1 Tax=Rhizobium esperanzae TaxID=1967781 RepID=A0A7W6W5M3_9HYPH|nr:hypothetical protein [Rhizobium esperanzae]
MLRNGAPDFGNRVEEPVVQVDDIEADSDEFEAVFDRDRDPDFLTIEYDSLLLHNKPRARHTGHHLKKVEQGVYDASDCRRRSVSDRDEITHSLHHCEETKSDKQRHHPPSSEVNRPLSIAGKGRLFRNASVKNVVEKLRASN